MQPAEITKLLDALAADWKALAGTWEADQAAADREVWGALKDAADTLSVYREKAEADADERAAGGHMRALALDIARGK